MIKNKSKGFTLMELLVVIVVLALIIAGVGTAVTTLLEQAKQGQFKNDAVAIIDGSKTAYTMASLGQGNGLPTIKAGDMLSDGSPAKVWCITFKQLKDLGFIEKEGENWKGYVEISVPVGGMGKSEYRISLTDGTYTISQQMEDEVPNITSDNMMQDVAVDSTCPAAYN